MSYEEKYWNVFVDVENPWSEIAKSQEFVLADEKETLEKFNENKKKEYKLQSNIPPDPYRGTPNAKIWVLLANCGYEENEPNEKGKEIIWYGDESFFQNKKQADLRIKHLIFQKTEGYCNHYLNKDFQKFVGWKWFKKRFVGSGKLLANEQEDHIYDSEITMEERERLLKDIDYRFFLLQAFAYSSERLHSIPYFPHMEYNKALLKWGLDNGKIFFIGRSADYWIHLIGELYMDRHPERFFLTRSSRSVYFTPDNVIRYDDWKRWKRDKNAVIGNVEEQLKTVYSKALY